MITDHFETPEFIDVQIGGRTVCVSFDEAVTNPEVCAQVVHAAFEEVDAWSQRFGSFFERINDPAAHEIVDAIRRAKATMLRQQEIDGAIDIVEDEMTA